MAVGHDSFHRNYRRCKYDHLLLHGSVADRTAVPDPEVGLPGGETAFRARRPVAALRGGLPDRRLAYLAGLPDGSKLPGHQLRSDLRAGGMAIGVRDGAEEARARRAPLVGDDGTPDRPVGRVRE